MRTNGTLIIPYPIDYRGSITELQTCFFSRFKKEQTLACEKKMSSCLKYYRYAIKIDGSIPLKWDSKNNSLSHYYPRQRIFWPCVVHQVRYFNLERHFRCCKIPFSNFGRDPDLLCHNRNLFSDNGAPGQPSLTTILDLYWIRSEWRPLRAVTVVLLLLVPGALVKARK